LKIVWSVTPTTGMPDASRRALVSSSVLHAVDLEGDVLHPFRGVLVAPHRRRVRELEEGQHVAVAGIHEQVHVGVGCVRGRHLVLGDGQHELHVQVRVPLDGLLGVLAAVGDVVDLGDLHVSLQDIGWMEQEVSA
jgi:hypothetical protein